MDNIPTCISKTKHTLAMATFRFNFETGVIRRNRSSCRRDLTLSSLWRHSESTWITSCHSMQFSKITPGGRIAQIMVESSQITHVAILTSGRKVHYFNITVNFESRQLQSALFVVIIQFCTIEWNQKSKPVFVASCTATRRGRLSTLVSSPLSQSGCRTQWTV